NEFFGKPSGLMDQMASSVGGFTAIDFGDIDNPVIEKVDFDITAHGHALCIVNTGGNHADLTNEYAAVPSEMRSVAKFFGTDALRKVDPADFYSKISELRVSFGDRAVLRAIHFFNDNQRAVDEKNALKAGEFDKFLTLVKESGRSSFMYLQNVYAACAPKEQGLSLALALTDHVLGERGAYRVHGGGFGGTIQAFVPVDMLDEYKAAIERVFGAGNCHVLNIRPIGGAKIS
ncbi:MAG: galactokinase, partial [Firmicutes bacterium]|nr:galactokinase [Bacillota bacterium]